MKLTAHLPKIELPFQMREPHHSPWRRRWMFLASAVGGAIAMFLADPQQGRRRRAMTRDRTGGIARQTSRRLGRSMKRFGATMSGEMKGIRYAMSSPEPVANDQMLTDRVMSQAFRNRDVDHSRINLNVEDGVVVLHGVLDGQDQIDALNAAVRRVPGVQGVARYLHPPHTPAPDEGPRHRPDGSLSNSLA